MIMKLGSIAWNQEKESRKSIDSSKICTFGIKPLDDVLYGILKKDFIVIGADSGYGKSQICLKIAVHNAMNNKKVGLYFIEGGDEEAIARIKWDLICHEYYSKNLNGIDMDYRKWRMNMIKDVTIDTIESYVFDKYKNVLDNIYLYGYEKGLTIQNFIDSLNSFVESNSKIPKVDLIIIDHLQYFTLTNPKQELVEQSEILKKVNEIAHGYKIPVILVSHLRKKEKDRGLPSQEDFYGTSNTPKMASIAITLSGLPTTDGLNYPTFFRFVKSRTKIPSNYAMLCNYNLKKSNYDNTYKVYKLKGDSPDSECLTIDRIPQCFRNSVEIKQGKKVKDLYESEEVICD